MFAYRPARCSFARGCARVQHRDRQAAIAMDMHINSSSGLCATSGSRNSSSSAKMLSRTQTTAACSLSGLVAASDNNRRVSCLVCVCAPVHVPVAMFFFKNVFVVVAVSVWCYAAVDRAHPSSSTQSTRINKNVLNAPHVCKRIATTKVLAAAAKLSSLRDMCVRYVLVFCVSMSVFVAVLVDEHRARARFKVICFYDYVIATWLHIMFTYVVCTYTKSTHAHARPTRPLRLTCLWCVICTL